MRDYDLISATEFDDTYRDFYFAVEGVDEPLRIFGQFFLNIERVRSVPEFLLVALGFASRADLNEVSALNAAHMGRLLPYVDADLITELDQDAARRAFEKLSATPIVDIRRDGNKVIGATVGHYFRRPRHYSDISMGMDPIFASMIVEAWGAFETLLTDVWKHLINSYCTCGRKAVKAYAGDKPKFRAAIHSGDLFDILRGDQFVNLGSLSRLTSAYNHLFPERMHGILDNEELRVAEAMRNLFAHRAGIADEKFRAIPGVPPVPVGDRVVINGGTAVNTVNMITLAATAFIETLQEIIPELDPINP